jgi:hypothetical protein
MSTTSFLPTRLNHTHRIVRKLGRTIAYRLEDAYRLASQSQKPAEIVNQTEIRIVGLRRTGNHAIIGWLKQQASGNIRLLNNVTPGENPYRYKYHNLKDYHPEHPKMMAVYLNHARGNLTGYDYLLYSYEDWGLSDIGCQRFEKYHDLYLGRSRQRFDVLIMRDPFNLLASRLKNNYREVKKRGCSVIDLWLESAREFLDETHYLPHNRLCINYPRWFQDKPYRQSIAQYLGLPFTDAGINSVTSFGGGSSFDGKEMDGQASRMDVNNRWRQFAENDEYRNLFQNQALWHYSGRIFGSIEGTEILRPQA